MMSGMISCKKNYQMHEFDFIYIILCILHRLGDPHLKMIANLSCFYQFCLGA